MNKNFLILCALFVLSSMSAMAYSNYCVVLSNGSICFNNSGISGISNLTATNINASDVLNPYWLNLTDQRYNDTTLINAVQTSVTNNATALINEILARQSIGNWTNDKSSYNTTSQLNTLYYPIGNINGYYNSTTIPSYALDTKVNSIGNWTNDKSSYSTTSQANTLYLLVGDQRYNDTLTINNEASYRQGNDSYLQGQITNLSSYNDTNVNGRITSVNNSLLSEITSRIGNDSVLDSRISAVNNTAVSGTNFSQYTNTSNLAINSSVLKTTNNILDIVMSFFTNLFYKKSEVYNVSETDNLLNAKLATTDQRYNDSIAISNEGVYRQGNDTVLDTKVNSLGNWSADKSSYATTSALSSVGNWSADKSSYTTTVNLPVYNNGSSNLTMTQVVSGVGNWSADKSSYSNTSIDWTNDSTSFYSILNPKNFQNDTQVNTTVTNALSTTTYLPTSVNLISGTNLTPINVANISYRDGLFLNVTGQLNLTFNFTNVTSFNDLRLYSVFSDTNSAHYLIIQIYIWNTSTWEGGYLQIMPETIFDQYDIPINDPSKHIKNNTVSIRILAGTTGMNANSQFMLDNINLLNGLVTPSVTSTNPVVGFDTINNGSDVQTLSITRYDGVQFNASTDYSYKFNLTDQRYNDTSAINAVQTSVSGNASSLSSETTNRQNNDTSLQNNINQKANLVGNNVFTGVTYINNTVNIMDGVGANGTTIQGNTIWTNTIYTVNLGYANITTGIQMNGSQIPNIANTFTLGNSSNPYLGFYANTMYEGGQSLVNKYANKTEPIAGSLGNWSADKLSYNTTVQNNALYYPLASNPSNYLVQNGGTINYSTFYSKANGTNFGNGGIRLERSSSTSYWDIGNFGGTLYFGLDGSTKYQMQSGAFLVGQGTITKLSDSGNSYIGGGNLGVKTALPTQALDVNGSVNVSGVIFEGASSLASKYMNFSSTLNKSQVTNWDSLCTSGSFLVGINQTASYCDDATIYNDTVYANNLVSSVGNWSADKGSYLQSGGLITTSCLGGFDTIGLNGYAWSGTSCVASGYYLTPSLGVSGLGNWSADKNNLIIPTINVTGNASIGAVTGQMLAGNGGGLSWNSTSLCLISPANTTNSRQTICVTQPTG